LPRGLSLPRASLFLPHLSFPTLRSSDLATTIPKVLTIHSLVVFIALCLEPVVTNHMISMTQISVTMDKPAAANLSQNFEFNPMLWKKCCNAEEIELSLTIIVSPKPNKAIVLLDIKALINHSNNWLIVLYITKAIDIKPPNIHLPIPVP